MRADVHHTTVALPQDQLDENEFVGLDDEVAFAQNPQNVHLPPVERSVDLSIIFIIKKRVGCLLKQ
ncbi:hypothetical protein [Legionella brunensis]|uniref:Uncharacterized protein n=1 Tax=Legionella brunensis TaxID=29422 RepID=A0A0W0SSX1_9GAMM|nr:hypothetical protein [Legionella brunensis]KTC86522.1 hypothetical protein Lbru_0463 [Legionella brunensis]